MELSALINDHNQVTQSVFQSFVSQWSLGYTICISVISQPVEFRSHYLVDGGILINFPLHVFDGESQGKLPKSYKKVQKES